MAIKMEIKASIFNSYFNANTVSIVDLYSIYLKIYHILFQGDARVATRVAGEGAGGMSNYLNG